MSAPDTNTQTEVEKHKPVLFGMGGVVGFAALLLLALLAWVVYNGQTPQGADVQIDGRTGAEVEASN